MSQFAPETLIVLSLAIPLVAAFAIPVFKTVPNVRDAITLGASALLLWIVVSLVPTVAAGGRPEALNFNVVDDISFALKLEPLGMLFICSSMT